MEDEKKGSLGSGRDNNLVHLVAEPVVLLYPGEDRFFEGRDAFVLSVLGEILLDGPDAGRLGVLGSGEIGFADAEVDDVNSLRLHGLGLGRDLEGRRGADLVDFF